MTSPERMPEFRPRVERSPEINIEGRIETVFKEISPQDATTLPLKDIFWNDSDSLRFRCVGKYTVPLGDFGASIKPSLYEAVLSYKDQDGNSRTVSLTDLTEREKPVLFTGDTRGFYAFDPAVTGRHQPFYLVGIQPEELTRKKARMVAVYHELGHVEIFDKGLDVKLFGAALRGSLIGMKKIAGVRAYAEDLYDAIPEVIRRDFQGLNMTPFALTLAQQAENRIRKSVSMFHERNAWAIAAQGFVNRGFPIGFKEKRSFVDYAKFCLGTYAKAHEDSRFVTGPGIQPNNELLRGI